MKSRQRRVRCKRCRTLFKMEASLADRLIGIHSPSCPRCPRCERRAKRQTARAIRVYHQFAQRRDECRRRDDLLSFSTTR